MHPKYAEIQNWLKNVITVDPPNGSEAGQHIFSDKKTPVVLFTIRPFFHLNIIHFQIFQIISKLIKQKFKCCIILHDHLIVHNQITSTIKNHEESIRAMDFFYEKLSKFISDISHIEIIPESVIWKCVGFNKSFFERIIQLSLIADKVANDGNSPNLITPEEKAKGKPNRSFRYISSLICLLYEGFVKPDFVFTGGKEAFTIWRYVRDREKLDKVFGNGYISPVMLVSEKIFCHNNHEEGVKISDISDPFCLDFKESDLVTAKITNQKYNEFVLRVNLIDPIYSSDNHNVIDIIKTFRTRVYS